MSAQLCLKEIGWAKIGSPFEFSALLRPDLIRSLGLSYIEVGGVMIEFNSV